MTCSKRKSLLDLYIQFYLSFILDASTAINSCRSNEWECNSGDECIKSEYHCDDIPDCKDQSDEVGCGKIHI